LIVLVARIVLAAVFAVAGVGKLVRGSDTEATVAEFGVSDGLRRPLALALPLAELAIAVALLPAFTAPWAGVAAVLVLIAFTTAVARVLGRGGEVDCNCFGSLGPSRIGRWTLVRNLVLLALAALVATVGWSDPGPGALAWVGDLDATAAIGIVAGLALLAAAVNFAFSWQLMKQNGRLLAELSALGSAAGAAPAMPPAAAVQLGDLMPAFELPDLAGRPVELDDLLDGGRGLLLFFSDPGCSACDPLLPEIGRRQRDPEADPRPVVISLGDADANRPKVAEHGLDLVLLQADFELARLVGVSGMPGAVVLDREGRLASESALGTEQVSNLLDDTAAPLQLTKVGARA
jgi:peroxiredoxin